MSERRFRILVVDRGSSLTDFVANGFRRANGPEVVHLRQTTKLMDTITAQGPWDVVIAGPSEETATGLRRLAELRERYPALGLIVAVNGSDPADLQTFVRAHPDELVQLPADVSEMRQVVLDLLDTVGRRKDPNYVPASVPAPPPPPPDRAPATFLTVGGPTGGSGKTFVAVNIAYLLSRAEGKKVVLLDLDTQFGEVSAALQLRPAHTLYDLLFDEQERPHDDAELHESVSAALTQTDYGFWVLPAPKEPAQADAVGAEEVGRLLAALRYQADYVVTDTPTGLRDIGLAALDLTDHLVAVTQIDVPGLYNLRSYLETLDRLGVDRSRRSIILNKDLPEAGVTAEDAVAVLGPVTGTLKFSAAVGRALNAGRPITEMDPAHEVSRALHRALAQLLPEGAALPAPPRVRFRWPWRKSA